MLDSNTIIGAFKLPGQEPLRDTCLRVFTDAVTKGTLVIAAPTLAELIRGGNRRFPNLPNIEIVSFDATAAQILGTKFPPAVIQEAKLATGGPAHYIKFDAMIVACAVRGAVTHVVSDDRGVRNLSQRVGIHCVNPTEYVATLVT